MKTNHLDPARSVMSWSLAVSGAWTIAAYIGANLLAIGILMPLRGEVSFMQGIPLAAAGAALAVLAWRKAYRRMTALESDAQEVTGAPRIADAALLSRTIGATA